jgi:small-conductance mechanosensitive channel
MERHIQLSAPSAKNGKLRKYVMDPADRHKKVEELKKDDDVRRELEQTSGSPKHKPKVKVRAHHKFELGGYILAFLGVGTFYYLLRLQFFDFATRYLPPLERIAAGMMVILIVLSANRLIKLYLIEPVESAAARFNLHRVVNLLAGVLVVLIALSVVFASWYTAAVSFGVISLVLGLALQTPITSFIGWLYILIKMPYRVGDRIKIEDAAGDVIDVGYLDTTLWEFGGQQLSTSHPSGRIIRFPNSKVLNSVVFNYSWPLFPYVWDEVRFNIAYQADLEFVAQVMRETAVEELGEAMMERVRTFRELLESTPVDQLEVKEHPSVVFRVNSNTWLEAICRYLVEPRASGSVKTRLIKKMLTRLNAEPERTMFPKSDAR